MSRSGGQGSSGSRVRLPRLDAGGGGAYLSLETGGSYFSPAGVNQGPSDSSGGAIFDPAGFFGYNVGGNGQPGTRIVNTEPSVGYVWEADYHDGTSRKVEQYFEAQSTAGARIRPLFMQYLRAGADEAAFLVSTILQGNPISFSIAKAGQVNGQTAAILASGSFTLYGPQVAADSYIDMKAPGGAFNTTLYFGAGTTEKALRITTNTAQGLVVGKDVAGQAIAYFYAAPLGGTGGAALAIGVNDNAATLTLDNALNANALKGLVVRRRSTQTGNFMENQDSAGAAAILSGVDRNGAFFDFVKATAGAPSTGTWATGACVLNTSDSKIYWCTAGGSPGTWKSVAIA